MPSATTQILTLIPTMFHRRLALLGVLIALGLGALSARVSWMTLADGERARALAESRLVRWSWLPTVRGRILDRRGRVLAMDRASYDIAIDYEVLSGEWARRRGLLAARRANKDRWDLLDDATRDEIAEEFSGVFRAHVDRALSLIARRTGTDEGAVMDRARAIVDRVESAHASIVAARVANAVGARQRQGFVVREEDRARIEAAADRPIREQTVAHPVVEGAGDEAAFDFMRFASRVERLDLGIDAGVLDETAVVELLPGLEVIDATRREHPDASRTVLLDRRTFPGPLRRDERVRVVVEDVASSLLGRVRDRVYKEDAERRRSALARDDALRARSIGARGLDRGSYLSEDRVGHTGLEAALEHELRGLRGVRTEDLRSGGVTETDPEQGRDVRLTIDAALTARIRAVLDPSVGLTRVQPWHANEVLDVGTPLDAAVCVLDIATGEVLALVSTPVAPRDGDWSRHGLGDEASVDWFRKVHSPGVHRAIEKPYQPGSVAKALILCGAAKLGVYERGERIEATGHLYPGRPGMLRSWIFKDYGITHADQLGRDPDAVDALMVSSNVFFFTLGQRLGAEGVREVYELFRVGSGYELGGLGTWDGSLGAFGGDGSTRGISDPDAIQMGIGQGPVTWTPLHAADAYATIARGGRWISPTLIRRGTAPEVVDLGLPRWACDAALEGLGRVVEDPDYGTGHHVTFDGAREPTFNAPGVTIWGKTGTATASPLVVDPDDEGPRGAIVAREGDHSWYVTLVAPRGGSPRYAISVVVDFGGSGGRVSGPINNQVIHALIDEGYLPDGRGGGP